jgi:hypothetical protein
VKATVGDQIVLAAVHVDEPTRSGEVIEVRGPDGGPPYAVRWDDGHVGIIYPGPGAVLRIGGHAPGAEPPPAARALDDLAGAIGSAVGPGPTSGSEAGHVREWTIRVSIFESGDDTSANVVLLSEAPSHLTARGSSHRAPDDRSIPEIGDEVAVARALRHLADQLLETAEQDIEALTGDAARLRRS